MSNTTYNTSRTDLGFTIVELLIVIVVIGILAAISIVAYNGISARANTSAGEANANAVVKVAEAYAADEANAGRYPTLAQLTAYTGLTRVPSGLTVNSTQLTSSQANGKTIQYVPKGTTGACVGYWDSTIGTPAAAYVYAGNGLAGSNVATPTCT